MCLALMCELSLLPSREHVPVAELLQIHKVQILGDYDDDRHRTRITVRRKHILQDTLHRLRNGADLSKPLRIVFIGESAVDDGGPLREFLYKVIVSILHNDSLFCGPDDNRVPRHNLVELEKKTFYYVGALIALSLIYGGPAPHCLSSAVTEYIISGVQKVEASATDIPDPEIRTKVKKVSTSLQPQY